MQRIGSCSNASQTTPSSAICAFEMSSKAAVCHLNRLARLLLLAEVLLARNTLAHLTHTRANINNKKSNIEINTQPPPPLLSLLPLSTPRNHHRYLAGVDRALRSHVVGSTHTEIQGFACCTQGCPTISVGMVRPPNCESFCEDMDHLVAADAAERLPNAQSSAESAVEKDGTRVMRGRRIRFSTLLRV